MAITLVSVTQATAVITLKQAGLSSSAAIRLPLQGPRNRAWWLQVDVMKITTNKALVTGRGSLKHDNAVLLDVCQR